MNSTEEYIAARIKRIARESGLAVAELNARVGCPAYTFETSRIKKYGLSNRYIKAAAEVLGVHISAFYKECPMFTVKENKWRKKYPNRPKSTIYICPECGDECYCSGTFCRYRFCPNCGKPVVGE